MTQIKGDDKNPFVNDDCIGCSACVAICPDVFELNEEGKAFALDLPEYNEGDVDDAISACPVAAISWKEKFNK